MPKSSAQNAVIREQTRKRIIEKATELFASNGYHATSISQIAKAAGMAKGAMYHYFENKQDLYVAIIKDGMEEIVAVYQVHESLSAREHLQLMFERLVTSMEENRDFWKLSTSLMTQGNMMNEMTELLQPILEVAMGGFMEMIKNLGLQKSEAEIMAFAAFIDGICLHYLFLYDGNYPIREVITTYLDGFLSVESS